MVHSRLWLAVVAVLGCPLVVGAQQHESAKRAGTPIVPHLAISPYPDGVTNEDEYAQWLARESTRLEEAAAAESEDPRKRIELKLIAVNSVLATQCEPAMSRFINGIDREDDRRLVARLTQQSAAKIESLRKAILAYEDLDDHDAEAVEQFNTSIDTLSAFSDALNAIVSPSDGSESVAPRRQAAIKLAEYLEDERPTVAITAMLWQSVLYGREGRIDRAMRSLPKVTESLHQAAIAFDFFARLLRCRFVKNRGAHATAWALLLTLEERARDWFPSGRERDEAVRSAVLEKISICDSWPGAANENERNKIQSWCNATTAELRSEYFGDVEQPTLLRLPWAAPIVVDMVDPEEPSSEASDQDNTITAPSTSQPAKTTPEEHATDPDDSDAPDD